MAYLKQRGKKWYAVWREKGQKITKATGITAKGSKEKKLAQVTADAMEAAATGAATLEAALAAVRSAAEAAGLGKQQPSIREYLESYIPGGKIKNARNYQRASALFLRHLESEAARKLDMLSPASCRKFLQAQLQRVSYGTTRHYLAMLNAAFNAAVREGLMGRNPFASVSLPRLAPPHCKRATERRPFTLGEMRTLLFHAASPWRQMVTISFLTGGQRLGDIACLQWSSVDFEHNNIRFRTGKTGKEISVPMVPLLRQTLLSLYQPGNTYAFPSMAQRYMRSSGSLSMEFTALLRSMGILETASGVLEGDRRPVSEKSFHSIRHTVVSMLRASNIISADLAREIVGHDSEAVERAYFTPSDEAKMTGLAYLCERILQTDPSPV